MAQQFLTSGEVSNAQVVALTKVYELFQNQTDLFSWTSKVPNDEINALGLKVPVELSPNPSFGFGTGNNDAFSTAGASNFHNYTVSYAFANAGTAETYAGVLNRNRNTSENMVTYQEVSSAKQFSHFLNCYISRGDSTAALATVSSNYSGGTPTVLTCNGSTDSIGCSQLVTGGYYLFYDAAGTTQRTGTVGAAAIQLSSKTGTAATFASNVPSDIVSTDIIVPQLGGSTDASGVFYGLPIIDDASGTYFGLARATYSGVASYEKSSAGTLTAGMLSETYFSTVQRGGWFTGDGTTNLDKSLWMVCNTGNLQNYYSLSLSSGAVVGSPYTFQHVGDKRPSPDLGMSSLNFTWFGAPIKVGNDIRGDEIYFLGKNSLRRAILKDVGMISDGFPASDYLQNINGDGQFLTARLRFYDFWGQFYAPQPYTISKISGLTLVAPTQKGVMTT